MSGTAVARRAARRTRTKAGSTARARPSRRGFYGAREGWHRWHRPAPRSASRPRSAPHLLGPGSCDGPTRTRSRRNSSARALNAASEATRKSGSKASGSRGCLSRTRKDRILPPSAGPGERGRQDWTMGGCPGETLGERQGSSVVEQRTHKPLVESSNLSPATNESKKKAPSRAPSSFHAQASPRSCSLRHRGRSTSDPRARGAPVIGQDQRTRDPLLRESSDFACFAQDLE